MPVRTKTTGVRYLLVGRNVFTDDSVYSMVAGKGQLLCFPQSEWPAVEFATTIGPSRCQFAPPFFR
jgi:hypothetical protein